MRHFELTAVSRAGRLGCLLFPFLVGCTGVIPGGSASGGGPPGGPDPSGGSSGAGTGGTTSTASSKPEVDVMTIRRLNRVEYTNTLRALLGTAEDHGAKFPADNLSFGFDNIGEALNLQPLHIELFEQSADQVLSELFARPAGDAARAKVLGCDPVSGRTCVVSTVLAFAERAFRRPVTEAEITPFVSISDSFTSTGGSADDGLKLALKSVLISPHFLFRVELDPSPTAKDVHPLNAFELATRLSYYLWSTTPDEALYADAKSGALATEPGLLSQISRMMMDGKAQALTQNFAGQWLNLRRMVTAQPDAAAYPAFDAELRSAMQTESSMFFAELFSQARPIAELLTSDFTFVNKKLAAFYGLAAPASDGFERVSMAGANRVGFLTQASFLTLTSNPNRTSPVKRGKWVLDQLLCSSPPPPPEGADLNLPEGGTLSVRAKLEQHRANEPCKSCHSIMDPIGLAFENFSGIGAYRTTDEYGTIDATGTLNVAGTDVSFSGAAQLVPILANDERLAPCVARNVLTYAVGRAFTSDDATALTNLLTATSASGQGLRGMFGSVAMSQSFRNRRAVGE